MDVVKDWIPERWRKHIYGGIGIVNLALAAGLLAPFGPELSDYVENVVQFVTAVVSGGAFTMAYRHTGRSTDVGPPADPVVIELQATTTTAGDSNTFYVDTSDASYGQFTVPLTTVPPEPEVERPPHGWVGFASRRRAETYSLAQWIMLLRSLAEDTGGALRHVPSGTSESIAALWPGTAADVEFALRSQAEAQLELTKEKVAGFPVQDGDTIRTGPEPPRYIDGKWWVAPGV